ncbi:MAG: hypothetical protein ACRD9S_01115 [Pyrinomonadaceae bacterium]
MVALLFTAIFIIGLLAIPLLFWAVRSKGSGEAFLPPPERPRGLFTEKEGFESAVLPPADPDKLENDLKLLSERARAGDKSALAEAQALGDRKFYDEVLDQLTANADGGPTLLALASYVTRNELPVNRTLAEALISSWKGSPDRSSTATTLHLTALADDADLYQRTVETALELWRQGLIANVSAAELRALFDGEFWVLSARTRGSGAGFILKRKLASARRELETAMRVN